MDDYDNIFDDDGALAIPTVRGSANLDVEDYEGYAGRSTILDDDLEEDTPSTPGRNPGSASATDIDGTDDFDMLEGDMDDPGMQQTTYGAYPWGPGGGGGYRPYSQQRTDMSLRALGDADEHHQPKPKPMRADSMSHEPEVIDSVAVEEVPPWDKEWHGNENQMPSNADVDPRTLYDRTSYEHNDSDQDTIGSGIFGMEEGVAWRPRDGMFEHDYSLPAYIAEEDELGVQQSAMWDSTAGEWRVTQPSASGVALKTRVESYKEPYSPFTTQMRPEVTGPRSHVEAFGRKASACLLQEARHHRPENRTRFLASAIEALGPGETARCRRAAGKLVELGYRADVAFEDAVAHCIMHAAVKDLTAKKGGSALPKIDRMAAHVSKAKPALRAAAAKHLAPLTTDRESLKGDLGALYASPAARGMGVVEDGTTTPPPTNGAPSESVITTKNVLIAGGLGLGAWLLWGQRKKIAKNIKKLTR